MAECDVFPKKFLLTTIFLIKHFKLAGSYFQRRVPANQNILFEYCSSESKSII